MNAKSVTGAVLVGLWWACAAVHAQQEALAPGVQAPPIKLGVNGAPEGMPPPGAAPSGLTGLSDYITYRRPDCCSTGPVMPLYSEAYLRAGPSVPVGGNYLGRELIVGWNFEGGVRALFFDQAMSSAWVVDAGIVNTNNGALSPGRPVTLEIFAPPTNPITGLNTLHKIPSTIRNYNRTFVSLGLGKEWYIWEPANAPGGKWRAGFDGGGRYGSSNMTFHEIRHRTRTITGTYVAAHTDYEIPCGCCFLAWGLRAEWAYTWNGILQRQSDVQDLNFMATFSVRY